MAHEPSTYQAAFYNRITEGSGNLALRARAGSGKTTTACGGAARMRGKIVAVAFGRENANDLAAKMPAHVQALTMHSLGLRACVAGLGFRPEVDKRKSYRIAERLIGSDFNSRSYRSAMVKAGELARNTLAHMPSEILALANAFDIPGVPEAPGARLQWAKDVVSLLGAHREDASTLDFTDMIWLPVVLDLPFPRFDHVIVDEAQDLNACQTELCAKLASHKGTRIYIIGDDRQAIYAFRGATHGAFDLLVDRFKCECLPLPVCYRCDAEIVALAAQTVPDIQAREGAPAGSVCDDPDYGSVVAQAEPGDFIISRSRAPLMGICLDLLVEGVPAKIVGRDIASGLVALIERSKAGSVEALGRWLDAFVVREGARLQDEDPDALAETLDKVAALRALVAGQKDLQAARARIEALFTDDGKVRNCVRLSTTHKAKGLEADCVWLLADTYLKRDTLEEKNLWYVAVTRARHELFLASAKVETTEEQEQ